MSQKLSYGWGLPARIMHAIGILLMFVLILHGWWMTLMVADDNQFAHLVWHGSFGYTMLLLVALRIAWRGVRVAPPLPQGTLKWERNFAALSQIGIYFLTLGMAIQGWTLAGTFEQPLEARLLGVIPMPMIMSGTELHDPLAGMHSRFAWMLAALILLHITVMGYHHFHKKDKMLQRMFW
jgi:cytochrome b561